MNRTTLATLASLAAAAFCAWQLGGRMGAGVLVGALTAAVFTGLGLAYLRHELAHRPRNALQALTVGFLVKLVVLGAGALALRFLPVLAERFDWRGYLVAFGAAAFLILIVGTAEILRDVKERRAT